jgi:hypothetical protein
MEHKLSFGKHGAEKNHLPPLNGRQDEDVERGRIQYDTMYCCIDF